MVRKFIAITLLMFAISAISVFAAWVDPGANPPEGNTEPPINTGALPQIKSGSLQIQGSIFEALRNVYLSTVSGRVGVGTASPGFKLDVSGDANATRLCIAGVCQASWPGVGALGGSGTVNLLSKFTTAATLGDSRIFDNGTNVGIGTQSPGSFLTLRRLTAGVAPMFAVRNAADNANTFAVDEGGILTAGSVPWARLTSFPAACPGGQFVTTVGGTLTCASPPPGGTGTVTRVDSGPGLAGGPIQITGTLSLNINGGVAQSCSGTDKIRSISSLGIVSCAADASGGTGTVTQVNSGTGLVSSPVGGIVSTGSLSLNINGGVTQACSGTDKIRSISPTGTVLCAADTDTDTNSGGTVTSVSSGAGLVSSPVGGIVGTGSLAIDFARVNTWTGAQTFSGGASFPGSGIWNTLGKVGIGTLTPDARSNVKLHVSNAGADAIITGVATPVNNNDAANRGYVDTAVSAASGPTVKLVKVSGAGQQTANCSSGWQVINCGRNCAVNQGASEPGAVGGYEGDGVSNHACNFSDYGNQTAISSTGGWCTVIVLCAKL